MRIPFLTFGAIASILSINSVFATTSTVTSKDYVDAADALKQDKITAGTTGNVVLYNGTQNGQTQFTGRAIYDDYDVTIDGTNSDNLVTAGALLQATAYIYDDIYDVMPDFDDLPETTVTYKTCVGWSNEFHNDNNCILWDLSNAKVYGKCHSSSDCNGSCVACVNGQCIEDREHCLQ